MYSSIKYLIIDLNYYREKVWLEIYDTRFLRNIISVCNNISSLDYEWVVNKANGIMETVKLNPKVGPK